MIYFVIFFLSFIPAFLLGYFFWRKDFLEPEPLKMLFLSFVMGVFSAVILIYEKNFLIESVSTWNISWLIILFFSVVEEFLKIFFLFLAGKFLHLRFSQIIDGAVYGVLCGLGFACVENFYYFFQLFPDIESFSDLSIFFSRDFWQVFFFRSLGSMLLHALTTGVFGLFWGYAIFSKKIAPLDTFSFLSLGIEFFRNFFPKMKKIFSLHILRTCILKNTVSPHRHEKIEVLKEGFVLSIYIHFIFNFLLDFTGLGKTPYILIVFFLVTLLGLFSQQFLRKRNIRVY